MIAIFRPHRTTGALLWLAVFAAVSAARIRLRRMAGMSGLCPLGPDMVAARGRRSRVRDYCGRVWDVGGKPTEICAIDWRGP